MKPIHHALVSARLFGGDPMEYLPVHNAFDQSKSALPDMRHRAALHSVDHGATVMTKIFGNRVGNATLRDLCVQHVNDDQGYDVTLDSWLSECSVPTFARILRRPMAELAGFDIEPEVAAAKRWGGSPEDFSDICAYYALPETFSDHPLAPAVSRNAFAIFFSEMAFGSAISITLKSGRKKYVPVRDIGECITIARYGRILTLEDVFRTMSKKDWMTGSRVAASRQRRIEETGNKDLFNENMVGILGFTDTIDSKAALSEVLQD